MTVEEVLPSTLAALPGERIVDLDVREELRGGGEPFSRIMAALQDLPRDGVFRLRAVFEPVPLYAVLARRGLSHWTERLAADDWRVWFYPAGMVPAAPARAEDSREEVSGEDVLDVRGLEPPEPMVRTLAALEALPAGGTLVQVNERVPQFLLAKLDELGFAYEVREPAVGPVRVFIRRAH